MANIKNLNTPSIAPYLSDVLTTTTVPSPVTNQFLEQLGVDILQSKRTAIELYNSSVSARLRKKVPDKLEFDEVAIILMTIFTFKNIRVSEKSSDHLLGVYVDEGEQKGIYVTRRSDFYRLIDPLVPYYRNRDIDDVLDKIERTIPTVTQTNDPSLFIVNNGVYNQLTDTLEPFSPDYVYLVKIPIDYHDKPKNPVLIDANDNYKWDIDSWINELADDEDTATLIWQVIADSLQPSRSRGKSIWFYSESGNNGKGTLGQLIKNLVGPNNYSSLSVTDFKEQFMKESLMGVAVNIADENDVDAYIDSVRDFKASITGDDINIDRKYEKAVRLQFKGTNIQMLNGLPKIKDKSDSFYRRLIIVPFLKSFTNNGEKRYIKQVYIEKKEVLEYALWRALHIKFDEYITPDKSAELLTEYKEINNPVIQFWNELVDEFAWDLLPTQFLYDLFVQWSKRNNPTGKPMGKIGFTSSLNTFLENNDKWTIKSGQNDRVRTGANMNMDEPLITEYNLVKWVDHAYTGSDLKKLRNFKRAGSYRGYVRN